jgi:hypothetical protein
LGSSETHNLRKTRFTKFLIQRNALDESGFESWIFCPGMLFNTLDKWWGDRERRDNPHEGLDFCLYTDRKERILRLDERTKIPAMYDGVVVRVFNDFLGKSVILEHSLPGSIPRGFCTIYGHTGPRGGLEVGRNLEEGEIIGTLADLDKTKVKILPHLHISLGWIPKTISYDGIDWETIGARNTLTLLDPLHILDWPYVELEPTLPPCLDL